MFFVERCLRDMVMKTVMTGVICTVIGVVVVRVFWVGMMFITDGNAVF